MRNTVTCLGLAALLCMLSGCAWFSGDSNPGMELAARAKSPVADLPVPMGFTIDAERSRTFDSGVARLVDHLYTGNASTFAVARFYKKAMVLRRWRFVNETFSLGDQDLRFTRPGETCRVRITPGSWLHPTKLKLELWTSEIINRPANTTVRTGQ
ncbi:MAG: hypothetical protein QGH94_12305 [Phycisphaerae bacterium]|jgi:hypothetical protein|nr:hypothetical protein [Phycisphaerae bacterium]MDP7288764.1 hypothetical protein [Phycisphaerae bacterium]